MLYDGSCQLGAGLSASRRAWERVSLHELRRTLKIKSTNMKKTIITLLALAGVASAAFEENLIWSADMTQGKYEYTIGDAAPEGFSILFNPAWSTNDFTTMPGYAYTNGLVKVGFEPNGNATNKTGIRCGDSFTISANCNLTGVHIPEGSDKTTFDLIQLWETATWKFKVQYNTETKQMTFGGDYTLSDITSVGVYELDKIDSITLTMDGAVNSDGIISLFINDSLAAYATMDGGNRHATSYLNAGIVFLNDREHVTEGGIKGGISSVSVYNTVTIPEPTTATLSLLALAGLAARRRRK